MSPLLRVRRRVLRRWRFPVQSFAIGCAVAALGASLYVVLSDAGARHDSDVRICRALNFGRHDANSRIAIHERQSRNFEALLRILTETRRAEYVAALTYPEPYRTMLTRVYLRAQRRDAELLAIERSIRFKHLPYLSCKQVAGG